MLKTFNAYAGQLGRVYADCPKAVLAAIAVSALTSGGDYLETAQERVAYEWQVLHLNGIVPQPLPAKYREAAERGEAITLATGEEIPA